MRCQNHTTFSNTVNEG